MPQKQFDYGQNWMDFSDKALDEKKIEQARIDIKRLLSGVELRDKSFLDIGFGQGLSLLIATEMKAKTVGCDINPKCKEVIKKNISLFPELKNVDIPIFLGSILETATVEKLKDYSKEGYDIVYSWGVLMTTGNMKKAIENAASLVKKNGRLVIAIYNRHWSSLGWLFIKYMAVHLPQFLQKAMVMFFYPIIYLAKLIVSGKDPMKKERGMDFYYDVVDWVCGYPYEYGSVDEIKAILKPLGFELKTVLPPSAPTGCNEFIFIKF
jgi:2-polyprenyl-3-methyl-5-hydroxy-6-metoxy-1,4-benzoquinol methylase